MTWQFAEVQKKLAEIIGKALAEGPQRIQHQDDAVVLISEAEYKLLLGKRSSLVEYLMNGPGLDDLDLERGSTPMRDVTF